MLQWLKERSQSLPKFYFLRYTNYLLIGSSDILNISYLKENDKRFMPHPRALYGTDVMFQQSD